MSECRKIATGFCKRTFSNRKSTKDYLFENCYDCPYLILDGYKEENKEENND